MLGKEIFIGILVGFLASQLANHFDARGRLHNFSAGPAALMLPVLKEAQANFVNYQGTGAAIFEHSHRELGGPIQTMMTRAQERVRRLLAVPDNYEVLYMHGGAHGQMAALPLNLCAPNQTADYVVTGFWSKRAHAEGAKQTRTTIIKGTSEDGARLLPTSEWKISADSCYVHFCASETIDGVEYFSEPDISARAEVPLVGDFTSTLLSRPVDVSKYGVVYASGGKNLGPSGFVLVIVRKDLLDRARANSPSILSWAAHARTTPIANIYNTPPVVNLWLHELTLAEYERRGGMSALAANVHRRKAQVYGNIDASNGFYRVPVEGEARSAMSVPVTIWDPSPSTTRRKDLEERFIAESKAAGLLELLGHAARPGLRVTLYHGIADEAVDALIVFMDKFRAAHAGKPGVSA